jgi:hypothetical protein
VLSRLGAKVKGIDVLADPHLRAAAILERGMGAITNKVRKRDSSVTMSSVMPSLKYCWAGSPLACEGAARRWQRQRAPQPS